MEWETVGKVHNKGKIAQIRCVAHSPLTAFLLKETCFLLLLLTEGRFSFTVDGRSFTAKAPCFVCFDETADVTVTSKAHAVCHAVYFHPMFLNVNMTFDMLRSSQYDDIATQHDLFMLRPFAEPSHIVPIPEEHTEHIEATFNSMAFELSEQRDWYWSCRSRSYFMELLLLLERFYGMTDYGVETENTDMSFSSGFSDKKKALLFVETHYADELRVTDIALACGMRTATLSALFRSEFGCSPLEYLADYRVRVAKKQLAFTDIPIKEIAVRCGFKTVPHFSRVFKEHTGATPAQYRCETVRDRKRDMNKRKLIAYAKERMSDTEVVLEDQALPQIVLFMSDSGELCEYNGLDDLELWNRLVGRGFKRVSYVVCMRQSGLTAMPPVSFLSVLRRLDDANLQTQILLEGRDGYYSKTVAEMLVAPKRCVRPQGQELQQIYEELIEKQRACLDPDLLRLNIHALHEALVNDEILSGVADFLEDHAAFALEHQRYAAFEILLGAPFRTAAYYQFVYAFLSCADRDGTPDAIERAYGMLLSANDPLCLMLRERGVASLRAMGYDQHAERLLRDSERVWRERRYLRSYRYASDALEVVFTEVERREMLLENEEDPGCHAAVAVIGCDLNVGDICGAFAGDERKKVFLSLDPLGADMADSLFQRMRDDYERMLSVAENGGAIRVWRNLREPHSACGFAFVCEALETYDCPLTVVDAPEECPGWGVVQRFVPYLLLEKTVTTEEKQRFAAMWRKAKEKNAPLRAYIDGELQSFSEDCYDDRLLAQLSDGRAVCIGEWMGRVYTSEQPRSGLLASFFEYRVREWLRQGILEVIVDGDRLFDKVVRRKADEPPTAYDLYVAARARIANVRRDGSLPAPLLYVVLSTKGTLYFFENDPVEEMVAALTEADDTEIACWVTLWGHMPPRLDVPSYAARTALLKLNGNNAQTELLLQGDDLHRIRLLIECV